MKTVFKTIRPTLHLSVATIASCVMSFQARGGPTTAPADTAVSDTAGKRPLREIVAEISADEKTVNGLIGNQNAALKTPADRAAVTPKLLPLVHRMRADLDELLVDAPKLNQQIASSQLQLLALLSALDEKGASDQIEEMAANKDPAQAAAGHAHQLMKRFYLAENTTQAQTTLVDDVEKLDCANPNNVLLTQLTLEMSHEEGLPPIRYRLLTIAADEMDNPLAASLKKQVAAMKAAKDQGALLENKPLFFSGNLVDGKSFSTESLKGKVVLVDFWATWCVPCRAELPRVKKLYDDYHSKGLELVAISNDYDATVLKKFIAQEQLPWPQLFDADAAANHDWNPLTVKQKIEVLPSMYLIDKKGILRTVDARDNMEELIPKLLAEAD